MKLRKISLAIASVIMMAGSTAAIAPAHAARTPEEYGQEVQRNFSKHWDEGVQWCVREFGEEQRSLCQYYTTMSLNHAIYEARGRHQDKADYFKSLADEAQNKLYESKYGSDSSDSI
ncbi:hypothetical protein UL82_04615 [Corynebacterium kutscheri]|uniref:Secreted protein n=1 Tax=Corynebacterium kutscheri TaxID=35755 RepID=A0A0F6QZE5_9CORY|nr:hypothetical protein [Corynebacterium kutscheri]AKE41107.1 hypothetical protein UL82_04615 [Corynebacterium kutscheri]VEH09425.1 Uncharacterised protein [Corynebacterium kutscheri]